MKRILISLVFCLIVQISFAQPPVPSTHGGWNYREQVSSPYQYSYYDNAREEFVPVGASAPLNPNSLLLFAMALSFVSLKIYLNGRSKIEK